MTDEEIKVLADTSFVDRRNNILPTRTFMGTDEELVSFARLIEAKTREECAKVCEDSANPRNDACSASYVLSGCAAAIRSMK